MSPISTAFYDPGDDLTGKATAAITGRRFVNVTAAKDPGSLGLANDVLGGNIPVAHVGVAGQKPLGVADQDQAVVGGKVGIMRGHKVVEVESGAAAVAGVEVMSDATGRAIAWVTAAGEANVRAGKQLNTTTAAGQVAIVALDL